MAKRTKQSSKQSKEKSDLPALIGSKELTTPPSEDRGYINLEAVYNEIADLRLKQGLTKRTIVAHLVKKYKISEVYGYKLVRKTSDKLSTIYNEMYEKPLIDALLFTESLKEQAMAEGDLKMTLEIQKELNKLNQLYVEKQMITIKPEQPLFKDEL